MKLFKLHQINMEAKCKKFTLQLWSIQCDWTRTWI